ncbi:MAG: C39 family peptidase, partial [Oscillospiraceae bacterium]
ALRKEVIAAEKAKAAAEKAERARISWMIRAQANAALAEQNEYNSLLPEAIVNLGVSAILQNPELPNGCEITALATLLNYKGLNASKTYLADHYLPQFPFYATGKNDDRAGGDPNYYFAGNPRSNSNAYYCFASPIVEAGNVFLQEQGSALIASDITGTDEQGLIAQLDAGNPIITWGTLSMGNAFTFAPNAWIINENGDKHIPFLNLHCVVLFGYDDTFFYLADPLRGNVAYKRSTFMNAYQQIGSRAVIIS